MQALVYVQELAAKDQMFLVGSINMFSLFCEFLFQWWRTPHGQHLGSKGKNMDIKHIFNRTDFWGGGNHVSSIDVWGRCNDRIALGQTFFFVVKKTPTVFEFWDLAHPPPKKKKQPAGFVVFVATNLNVASPKNPPPPFFVSRFAAFERPGLKLNTKLNAQIGWVLQLRLLVGQTISEGRTYHQRKMEPDIFLLP